MARDIREATGHSGRFATVCLDYRREAQELPSATKASDRLKGRLRGSGDLDCRYRRHGVITSADERTLPTLSRTHYVLLGMVALLFGLALPLASIPILGQVNLLSYSFFVSYLVLVAIVFTGYCLFLDLEKITSYTGIALLALFLIGLARFEYALVSARRALTGEFKENPFAGIAAAAAASVHPDYGIFVLIVGSILLIVPRFLKNTRADARSVTVEWTTLKASVFGALTSHRNAGLAIIAVLAVGFLGSAYADFSNWGMVSSSTLDVTGATSSISGTTSLANSSDAPARAVNDLQRDVSVQPISIEFIAADPQSGSFEDAMQIKLQYHNLGSKGISAFKGRLTFTNQFGDRIQSYAVDVEGRALRPGSVVADSGTWDFNKFEHGDERMRSTPLSQMRYRWEPTNIIFEDGSKLSANGE